MTLQDKLGALVSLAHMMGLFDRAKESAEERSPLNLRITASRWVPPSPASGRGARATYSRSRSMAISGVSAGGIG